MALSHISCLAWGCYLTSLSLNFSFLKKNRYNKYQPIGIAMAMKRNHLYNTCVMVESG